nr:carbonate dehydratase [Rubripirellula tenax]
MHLKHLLENNKAWSRNIAETDPSFFEILSKNQKPDYLWIGCSDSRVPANQIVGLRPGDLFVHRNVANLVVHTDLNCLSVMQYAVQVLEVEHIIICGHYGCGGVGAALFHKELGLIENWLRHIQDVSMLHQRELDAIESPKDRVNKLCEFNVIEQAMNVCRTTIVRDAWRRGQKLAIHGWIYALDDGLLQDLSITVSAAEEIESVYEQAIANRRRA